MFSGRGSYSWDQGWNSSCIAVPQSLVRHAFWSALCCSQFSGSFPYQNEGKKYTVILRWTKQKMVKFVLTTVYPEIRFVTNIIYAILEYLLSNYTKFQVLKIISCHLRVNGSLFVGTSECLSKDQYFF